MFSTHTVKLTACAVIVAYVSLLSASGALAAQRDFSVKPRLLAQAGERSGSSMSTEERRALREIYLDKIGRIEAEMNGARGSRNTMLTTAVSTFLIGAGIMTGSSMVEKAVNDIPPNPENEEDIQTAEDAMKALKGVGVGIIGAGGVSLLGWMIYTGIISSKQKKVDRLREEMDETLETKGLTPEYLQKNPAVAQILDEIANTKKSAATSRSWQGFFSRLGIGTLLSGGFLVGLSSLADEVVDEIPVNESDPAELQGRQDAIDEAENLQTTGLILLGVGAASEVLSFAFRLRAGSKENRVEELEDSLLGLTLAERIHIQPRMDGFVLMYSQQF